MNAKCHAIISPIRIENSDQSEMISQMLYGETCEILETNGDFIKIKTNFDGTEGWINKQHIEEVSENSAKNLVEHPYGIFDLPEGKSLLSIGSEIAGKTEKCVDKENLRESIAETAKKFLNVPYLHGGRSFFGIDDDGFSQLVFKVHGIGLPRKAENQAELGEVLDFLGESEAGDLAFFDDENGKINHVGIMLNNYELIHVNGKVRIDSLDSSGIFNSDLKKHTHKLRFVKKILFSR